MIGLPALLVLGAWFVFQLLSGTQALRHGLAGGVAWWAHAGGFLAGMALMPLLNAASGHGRRPRLPRESREIEEADNADGFW